MKIHPHISNTNVEGIHQGSGKINSIYSFLTISVPYTIRRRKLNEVSI